MSKPLVLLLGVALLLGIGGTGGAATAPNPPATVYTSAPADAISIRNTGTGSVIRQVSVRTAGTYVLWAKAYLWTQVEYQEVTCSLVAGSNDDQTDVSLHKGTNETVVLHVIHTFTTGGMATFSCKSFSGQMWAYKARVTAVQVAGATNRSAALGSPSIPQTPTDTYSSYSDGPAPIYAVPTLVGSLSIPEAGNYVLWAKAYLRAPAAHRVACTLTSTLIPASSGDESRVDLRAGKNDTIANFLVISFLGPAVFKYVCTVTGGTGNAYFVKITALRVHTIETPTGRYPPMTSANTEVKPADVYSSYRDDKFPVTKDWTTVATVNVAKKGRYLLLAKAFFTLNYYNRTVTCVLKAGDGDDESKIWVDLQEKRTDVVVTQLVHTFNGPGTATFKCKSPGEYYVYANWAKATAIRVTSIVNRPFSG